MSNDFSNVLCVVVVVHNEISEDDVSQEMECARIFRVPFSVCCYMIQMLGERHKKKYFYILGKFREYVCVCVYSSIYETHLLPRQISHTHSSKNLFFFVFPKYSYYVSRKSAPPPGKRLKAPNFIVRTRFHSFCFLFAFFIMYCCFIKCIIHVYTKNRVCYFIHASTE